jgi:hypothetical protein
LAEQGEAELGKSVEATAEQLAEADVLIESLFGSRIGSVSFFGVLSDLHHPQAAWLGSVKPRLFEK